MKTVAITGPTQGIGLAIAESLRARDYRIQGFSRELGYDIARDAEKIVAEASGADIFINNAHSGFTSVQLLYMIFEKWREQDKIIINISSDSGDGSKDFVHPYAVAKAALDKAVEQLQNVRSRCRVVNLRPGYVDTPRVAHVQAPKMAAVTVAEMVQWVLAQPPEIYLRNMSFRAREVDL